MACIVLQSTSVDLLIINGWQATESMENPPSTVPTSQCFRFNLMYTGNVHNWVKSKINEWYIQVFYNYMVRYHRKWDSRLIMSSCMPYKGFQNYWGYFEHTVLLRLKKSFSQGLILRR